jgi:transposase
MPKPESIIDPKVTPKPEFEKSTRRRFTTEYKLSILQQANACQYGELAALLRREKLYSNQIAQWRREFAQDGIEGLSKSLPGPKPSKTPEQKRIEQLEKENARLLKELSVKDSCIALQKKALTLIESLEKSDLLP